MIDQPQHLAVAGPPPTRLAFVDIGPRSAPPILFIHGVGGWHGQWSAQLAGLADSFRCLAPTLPGHHPSEVTGGPWNMERLRETLHQFVIQRRLGGPINIVAHSYGGLIAFDLALHHPELINKIVVLGLAEQMNFGLFFRLIATLPLPNAPLDLARRIWLSKRFYASVHVLRPLMRQAVLPWTGWAKLDQLQHAILLLAGQFDVVAPPPKMRALVARLPHARGLIVRGARHKLQIQQPEIVNRMIKAFLSLGTKSD